MTFDDLVGLPFSSGDELSSDTILQWRSMTCLVNEAVANEFTLYD